MFKLQSRIARVILNVREKESTFGFEISKWPSTNDLLTLSSNERYQFRSNTKTNLTYPKPKNNFLNNSIFISMYFLAIPIKNNSTWVYVQYVHTS